MTAGEKLRLVVINQEALGGATAMAREVLEWGPPRGFEVCYLPGPEGSSMEFLKKKLRGFQPHLIHLHCWYQSYPYALPLSLQGKAPLVLTLHDVFVVNQYGEECWECYKNPWCLGCPALGLLRRYRPNYRILERLRKRRLNRRFRLHLILPSAWMQRRLAATEWSRFETSVIPYGVPTELFKPGPPVRERFGLPNGPLVLFVGHMYSPEDHRKGLPDLIEAWPAVRRACPAAHLVLAGKLKGTRFPEGVIPLGDVLREALPDLYRTADLLCLPSRGDNLPVTVLEALASGLPVVATSVGGIPEMVPSGKGGLLVPPRAPRRLGEALAKLLLDPAGCLRHARAAREQALLSWSRQRCAARHEALYRRLAGR